MYMMCLQHAMNITLCFVWFIRQVALLRASSGMHFIVHFFDLRCFFVLLLFPGFGLRFWGGLLFFDGSLLCGARRFKNAAISSLYCRLLLSLFFPSDSSSSDEEQISAFLRLFFRIGSSIGSSCNNGENTEIHNVKVILQSWWKHCNLQC